MKPRNLLALLVALAIIAVICERATADPLPGQVLKFQQLPLNNGLLPGIPNTPAAYPGHNEWSTARAPQQPQPFDFQGTFMADDFADSFSTPVYHVRWWGSYDQNNFNEGLASKFLISFETDVPANPNDPNPFSRPGAPLQSQIVTENALAPGSGTFTEKQVNGAVAEHLYEYNAELALPFQQQKDTIYWLKIVALNDPAVDGGSFNWGWHNRDWGVFNPTASTNVSPGEGVIGTVTNTTGQLDNVYHFQDDAVQGTVFVNVNAAGVQISQSNYQPQTYIHQIPGVNVDVDGPFGIQNFSKDLAFELYTVVPEPAAVALFGAGALGLGLSVWKRRRRPAAS